MSPSQFQVTDESWGNHYHVIASNDSGKHHLFIENNPFSKSPYDMTIHDGPNIEGRILGVSKFRQFTSNCDVKLDDDKEWIPMVKKGLISPSYSFEMSIDGINHKLSWKKTRSMGIGASAYGNSKLVDEESQAVLAVFSSDPHSLVTGQLDIYGDHGKTFGHMALLTGLVFREKQRRQSTRTARAGRDDVFTTGTAIGGAGGGGC
ncbi:hypothetical protein N7478_011534 [Penicillium angulare]|uniref:uncharacterized protein n=1 Tax=Penicillium angulare TaxID=116970 RepID=UPI00253FC2E8|nr:uncharacterized protein N7478_011534 [Penicillium angulare]KAJ5263929.1 hypothetical protein N7478_011534 [Penicillium angulare]